MKHIFTVDIKIDGSLKMKRCTLIITSCEARTNSKEKNQGGWTSYLRAFKSLVGVRAPKLDPEKSQLEIMLASNSSSWHVTFKHVDSSSCVHKWNLKQFANLHKQNKQRYGQMSTHYGSNKSNDLIIQRVMKRQPKLLMHIGKAKKIPKCQRKGQATRGWARKKQDNQESWLNTTPFKRTGREWWGIYTFQ